MNRQTKRNKKRTSPCLIASNWVAAEIAVQDKPNSSAYNRREITTPPRLEAWVPFLVVMVTVVAPFIRAPASQSPAIRKRKRGLEPADFGLFLSPGSASSSPVARPRSSMVSCRSRSIHEGDTGWGGGPGRCGHVKVVTTGRLPLLVARLRCTPCGQHELKHTIRRLLPLPRSSRALSSLNLSNNLKQGDLSFAFHF